MEIVIQISEEEEKFLRKICYGMDFSDYLETFLKNNLFNIEINPDDEKYEKVKKLMFMYDITQKEMADAIELNQSSLARALKQNNKKSSLFKNIEKSGSPEKFIFDVKKTSLKKYFSELKNKKNFDILIHDASKKSDNFKATQEFLEILCGFCFKKMTFKFTKELFESRIQFVEIGLTKNFQPIFLESEKFLDRLEDSLEFSYTLIEDGLSE